MAAWDRDETIVNLSFQSTNEIVKDLFANNNQALIDAFQDCVKCLSEFGSNPNFEDVAMNAIALINTCAKYVSEHKEKFDNADIGTSTSTLAENTLQNNSSDHDQKTDRVWIRGWFPVLIELSAIINRSKLDVRTRSLTILFNIVQDYGESFESGNWADLFNLLFRSVVTLDMFLIDF